MKPVAAIGYFMHFGLLFQLLGTHGKNERADESGHMARMAIALPKSTGITKGETRPILAAAMLA